MLLGDGNLHTDSRNYCRFTVDHGISQSDYCTWKGSLLATATGRDIKIRSGHRGKSIQFSTSMTRFRSWRKFTYPGGKKDLARILPFIRHPELALAIWLMDDGYCEPSFSKLADGSKKNYGARLRIFTCDQSPETQVKIKDWLDTTFGINVTIKKTWSSARNKHYPFIKINQADSLKVWEIIRTHVLQFKSMQYKFRYLEQIYQVRSLQPQAAIVPKT